MDMTFRQKSLWITLAALAITSGCFIHSASTTFPSASAAGNILPGQAGLFIAATVLLVLILVIGHVVLAVLDRHQEPDERDRIIEWQASRHGAQVLAVGVFLALCTAMATEGNAIMAYVLLGFWVLSQTVEAVAQLVLYRLGR